MSSDTVTKIRDLPNESKLALHQSAENWFNTGVSAELEKLAIKHFGAKFRSSDIEAFSWAVYRALSLDAIEFVIQNASTRSQVHGAANLPRSRR